MILKPIVSNRENLNIKEMSSNIMGTLLFGRLIFDTKIHHYDAHLRNVIDNRKQALLEVINFDTKIRELLLKSNKKKYALENTDWHFAGIKLSEDYLYGKLGKETEAHKPILDKEKRDYIIQDIKEPSGVVIFLIDLKNSVIAYELKNNVGEKAPIEIIQETFNVFHNKKEELEISIITDKKKIINRMKQFSVLRNIKLRVSRTNPDSTSGSDEMDNFLKKGHIKRLKLEAISDENGIDLNKISLLKSGFHLAEEGYGTAIAKGDIGRKQEKFSAGDLPIKKENASITKDDEVNIKNLIYYINGILKELESKLK